MEKNGRQGTASLAENTILLSKFGSFLDDSLISRT